MISFLRRIRHQLLTDNKISKYLLYALGEILLVVIGILFALQINNWNSEKSERRLEINTLEEMRQNLVQDTLVLRSNLEILSEKEIMIHELIQHIEQKRAYMPRVDTLQMEAYYHRGYNTFNTAAFELLKERGFDIIQNNELRKVITSHYTTDLADIRGILGRLEKINLLRAEQMYDHFLVSREIVRAYDYQRVLDSPVIFGPFYHFETMNRHTYNVLNGYRLNTITLLNAIDSELESRSSRQ